MREQRKIVDKFFLPAPLTPAPFNLRFSWPEVSWFGQIVYFQTDYKVLMKMASKTEGRAAFGKQFSTSILPKGRFNSYLSVLHYKKKIEFYNKDADLPDCFTSCRQN